MKEIKKNISTIPLDGGNPCFDFINTVHSRKEEEIHDFLNSYEDFLKWCNRVRLLPQSLINDLLSIAKNNPHETEKNLAKIKSGREKLYEMFSDYIAGKPVAQEVLKKYNIYLHDSLSKMNLHEASNRFEFTLTQDVDPMLPFRMIIKSSYDLITTYPKNRLKECSACGWIFLDKSKNKSRKWCSMDTCGSIDKSLRYYYKKKREKN